MEISFLNQLAINSSIWRRYSRDLNTKISFVIQTTSYGSVICRLSLNKMFQEIRIDISFVNQLTINSSLQIRYSGDLNIKILFIIQITIYGSMIYILSSFINQLTINSSLQIRCPGDLKTKILLIVQTTIYGHRPAISHLFMFMFFLGAFGDRS